jgi:hypothetical protein
MKIMTIGLISASGCTQSEEDRVQQTHSAATVVVASETFVFGSGRADAVIEKGRAYQAQSLPKGEYAIWAGTSHTYVMMLNVPMQFGFILDQNLCTTGEVAVKTGAALSRRNAFSSNNNNYDAPKGICFKQA